MDELGLTDMSRQVETLRVELQKLQLQREMDTLQREINRTYSLLTSSTPGAGIVHQDRLHLDGSQTMSPISRRDEMLLEEQGQQSSSVREHVASLPRYEEMTMRSTGRLLGEGTRNVVSSNDEKMLEQRGQLLRDRELCVSHSDDGTVYNNLPSSLQQQVTKCDGFAAGGSSYNPLDDHVQRSSRQEETRERRGLCEQSPRMMEAVKTATSGQRLCDDMLDRRCQEKNGSSLQVEATQHVLDGTNRRDHYFEQDSQQNANDRQRNFDHSQTRSNLSMRPATYDGSSSWSDYKAHFEACASLNGWDKIQKGLYLSVSLRGQVQGVFGNLASSSTDYTELVKALEERFAPPNQTELYRVQLRDRQQRATDSMAGLGQDVRRLTNLAYPTAPNDVRDTLAKEQFIDALINSELRLRVKQARPVDLNDAVRHAVELESFYKAEKQQHGLVRSASLENEDYNTDLRQMKRQLDSIQRSLTSYDPTAFSFKGQQFNQQQPHRMNGSARFTEIHTFDRKIKCFKCGQEGHIKRYCPQKQDHHTTSGLGESQSQQPVVNRTSTIRSAGLHANGFINETPVNCLIDTGATLSLISVEVWESIRSNNTMHPFDTPIMSASGNKMTVLGSTNTTFVIGGQHCPMTVIIAEMDVDVALGIDFMREYEVNIDVCREIMFVQGQEVPLSCTGRIGCDSVAERVDVPAVTRVIVTGNIDADEALKAGNRLKQDHPVSAKDYVFSLYPSSEFKAEILQTGNESIKEVGRTVANNVMDRIRKSICSVCKGTVDGDMKAHQKICQGRVPCGLCRKTFMKRAYMKRHVIRNHYVLERPRGYKEDKWQEKWDRSIHNHQKDVDVGPDE